MRRKYIFRTRAAAEDAYIRAADSSFAREIVIQELIWSDGRFGPVTWYRKGPWEIALVRPTSVTGGYVLQSWHCDGQLPFVDVKPVYDWAQDVAKWATNLSDPEAAAIQDIRHQVLAAVYVAKEAEKVAV